MRIAFALVASLIALGLSTPTTAQVISVSQVLTECPDFALAQACPSVATEFLEDRRPGTRRNGQVVNLVVAIAEAAQPQTVPRPVCLNAAEGLRVLAAGVTNEDQAKQITDIADALCLGNRTAAIRRPGGLFDSLSSGSNSNSGADGNGNSGGGGGSGGGNPDPGPDPNPDPGDDGCSSPGNSSCNGNSENSNANDNALNQDNQSNQVDEVDEVDEDEGDAEGLGSNDAANSPNEHAQENANDNATDNTHGQNGDDATTQTGGGPPDDKGPPEGKGKPN